MKIILEQPNGFTSHFAPQQHKYLENSSQYKEHARNRFNPYVNNQATIVAVARDDFILVGGETRLSEGYSIFDQKLEQISTTKFEITQILKAKLQIYDYKIVRQPNTESVAYFISKTLYGRRFFPYYTFNLVAGLNKNGKEKRFIVKNTENGKEFIVQQLISPLFEPNESFRS